MIARLHGRPIRSALLALACAALALPATAAAQGTGGGGLGDPTGTTTGTPTTTTPTTTTATATAIAPVSTSGNGITLSVTSSTILRDQLTFSGTGTPGQTIEIERSSAATGGRWLPTAQATADSTGAFSATWSSIHPGRLAIRAVVLPAASGPAAVHTALAASTPATPAVAVTVYRGARATFYGPGLFGRRLACGGRLSRATIGVANRTLPCGTQVTILYAGRTLTVPVIDRGPYANHADWDLTQATALALGMTGTSQIGTVAAPATAAPTTP